MATNTLRAPNSYDPNRLLDRLKEMLNLDSDIALSRVLEVPPPVISQIRHRGYPIGPSILIRMHDVTLLSVQELRDIMGDRRKKVRSGFDAAFVPELEQDSSGGQGAGSMKFYFYILVTVVLIYMFWSRLLR